jgi:dolichol-phosphate mannosyltransferase
VTLLARWVKFNFVGAMGMLVQLAALALFDRWASGHYLYATTAAVELSLLHNFTWHLHYTWRDRRHRSDVPRQLLRFHLSNGLVSMLGNLALMRFLVHDARLPLLAANTIAILSCSVINFCLGDIWAFAATTLPARDHAAEMISTAAIASALSPFPQLPQKTPIPTANNALPPSCAASECE